MQMKTCSEQGKQVAKRGVMVYGDLDERIAELAKWSVLRSGMSTQDLSPNAKAVNELPIIYLAGAGTIGSHAPSCVCVCAFKWG